MDWEMTPARWKAMVEIMHEQNAVHPNFASSWINTGWILPFIRPVHLQAWPAPVYHNDNWL